MLTTEQCIRVATELWGWEWHPEGSIPSGNEWKWQGRWMFDDKVVLYKRDCSSEVNSWQGFGRTWDFFRDKHSHCITIDFCWHEDAESWACNVGIDTDYSFNGYGETEIEAIHLAALEAINDNQ